MLKVHSSEVSTPIKMENVCGNLACPLEGKCNSKCLLKIDKVIPQNNNNVHVHIPQTTTGTPVSPEEAERAVLEQMAKNAELQRALDASQKRIKELETSVTLVVQERDTYHACNESLTNENNRLRAVLKESEDTVAMLTDNGSQLVPAQSSSVVPAGAYPKSIEVVQTPVQKTNGLTSGPTFNNCTFHVNAGDALSGLFQQQSRNGGYVAPQPALKYIPYLGDTHRRVQLLQELGVEQSQINNAVDSYRLFDQALRTKGYTCDK